MSKTIRVIASEENIQKGNYHSGRIRVIRGDLITEAEPSPNCSIPPELQGHFLSGCWGLQMAIDESWRDKFVKERCPNCNEYEEQL